MPRLDIDYMSGHSAPHKDAHPKTAYQATPENEGVWSQIKNAIFNRKERPGIGQIGGASGTAKMSKAGVLK